MIVNLIVIALVLFFGYYFHNLFGSNKNLDVIRKRYIIVISIFYILQSGLRNVAVGDDTFSYLDNYKDIRNTSWHLIREAFVDYYKYNLGKDPGYLVVQKIEQSLFFYNFQFYLILIAIAFFSTLGYFIFKNTTRLVDVMLAYIIYSVLFYSFYSITGIRQTLAMIFIMISYKFAFKKKIIPFLLLVFLASTLHKSSLIVVLFYFVSRFNTTKYLNFMALLLFPIFFAFKEQISLYLRVLSGYEDYGDLDSGGNIVFLVLFLTIYITAMVRSKVILENNPNAKYYFNAFSMALVFLPLSWINPNAIRITMYFTIYMLLLIPEIIHSFHKISNKFRLDAIALSLVLLIGLFIKASWNEEKRMPYGFFWEDMKLTKQYYERDM